MKQQLMLIVLLLIGASAEGAQSVLNKKGPDFQLQDQYDRTFNVRMWEGSTIILIASDEKGSEQNAPWRKVINEHYGGRMVIQGVADVRSVPFFLKGSIKKDFQKDTASILLDWEGTVLTAYGLVKDVSNIVVIDDKGVVRHIYSGPATPAAVERLTRAIENLHE